MNKLKFFRNKIDKIDDQIIDLLTKRKELSKSIALFKQENNLEVLDKSREKEILDKINDEDIKDIFKEIIKKSKKVQSDNILKINSITKKEAFNIGDQNLIMGPCSIESKEQFETVANFLSNNNIKYIRAGAFKPRTSPNSFQGLGQKGIDYINKISKKYNLTSISEVMSIEQINLMKDKIDILQVGARNMQNFNLLNELSKIKNPILLKRGFANTLEEFIMAAEYLLKNDKKNIILCERGIRSFDKEYKTSLDLLSIATIKNKYSLPLIVDLSHAIGKRDIDLTNTLIKTLFNLVDGFMIEIHPNPKKSLSDSQQQFDLSDSKKIIEEYYKWKK